MQWQAVAGDRRTLSEHSFGGYPTELHQVGGREEEVGEEGTSRAAIFTVARLLLRRTQTQPPWPRGWGVARHQAAP